MISIVLYGRNDNYGYNLHKRAALSLNCMAEVLTDASDEILFVDYNTPDDFPTLPEAIQDTLTQRAKAMLRILRVRPHVHEPFKSKTRLLALEPIARNVAIRRSAANNRWILSTNTDMIFVPLHGSSLSGIAADLDLGFYHAPRLEIPEMLWETLNRSDPIGAMESIRNWGPALHLNTIVIGPKFIRYDNPGDFQLLLRSDLFENNGFDERMLLGWHVDSNIAARMQLKYKEVGDLGAQVYGYHCDHTRQVTPPHSHLRVQNDWKRFVSDVARSDVPEQAETWGCRGEPVEEIRLPANPASIYVQTLREIIGSPMAVPTVVEYTSETYNRVDYDLQHLLPFLADMFLSMPRVTNVAWYGGRAETLRLFAAIWNKLHFTGKIFVDSAAESLNISSSALREAVFPEIIERADVFVFDFGGIPPVIDRTGLKPNDSRKLRKCFRQVVRAEQRRQAEGALPRRIIALNAINNEFERLVCSSVAAAITPCATHMRHGFVLPAIAGDESWLPLLSIGEAGIRVGEHIRSDPTKVGWLAYGPFRFLDEGEYLLSLEVELLSDQPALSKYDPCLFVEVRAGAEIIALEFLRYGDLKDIKHKFSFSISKDVADGIASLETRVAALKPIAISLRALAIERRSLSAVEEIGIPMALRIKDWLPFLRLGPLGCTSEMGVVAENGPAGFVVYGPSWSLPPGKYEMVAVIEPRDKATFPEHLVRADVAVGNQSLVAANFHLVAANFHLATLPYDLDGSAKTLRLPFELKDADADARQVETRIFSSGETGFVVRSVSVRPVEGRGTQELLPYLLIGEVGARASGEIRNKEGHTGYLAYSPTMLLDPGAYKVRSQVTIQAAASTISDHQTCAILLVKQGFDILAIDAITHSAGKSQDRELTFEIALESRNAGVEFLFQAVAAANVSFRTLTLQPADLIDRPTGPVVCQIENWLPLLSSNPVAKFGEEGLVVSKGDGRYALWGPYWTLPAGRYELIAWLIPHSPALDGNPFVSIDVSSEGGHRRFAEHQWRLGQIEWTDANRAIECRLPFEIPADLPAQSRSIETRVFARGNGQFGIRSIRVVTVSNKLENNWFPYLTVNEGGVYIIDGIKGVAGKLGDLATTPPMHISSGRYKVTPYIIGTDFDGTNTGEQTGLGLEIISGSDIIAIGIVKAGGSLEFDVAPEEAREGVKLRLVAVARFAVTVRGLAVENTSDFAMPRTTPAILQLDDWLPFLQRASTVNDASQGAIVSSTSVGWVCWGPYWVLPAGRYDLVASIIPHNPTSDGRPFISIDVSAEGGARRFAEYVWHLGQIDPAYTQSTLECRLPFTVPAGLPAQSRIIETRLYTPGNGAFRICSLRIKRQSTGMARDWLAYLAPGECGIYTSDGISSLSGRFGCIAETPLIDISPGRHKILLSYGAANTKDAKNGAGTGLALQISARSKIIAIGLIANEGAFLFDIEEDFAREGIQLRVLSTTGTTVSIRGLSVERISERATVASVPAILQLDDWLPFLHRAPTVHTDEHGLVMREGVAGVVCWGPYWDLPPGHYQVTASIIPRSPTRDGKPMVTLDVTASSGQRLVAGQEWMIGLFQRVDDSTAIELAFPFTVQTELREVETRLRTSGEADFRVKSLTVKSIDPDSDRDWFPYLLVGECGIHAGRAINCVEQKTGCVAYTRQLDLSFGNYDLLLDVADVSGRDGTPSAVPQIEIEVRSGAESLVSQRYRIGFSNRTRAVLTFDINKGPTTDVPVQLFIRAISPAPIAIHGLRLVKMPTRVAPARLATELSAQDWRSGFRPSSAALEVGDGVLARAGMIGRVGDLSVSLASGRYEMILGIQKYDSASDARGQLVIEVDGKVLAAREFGLGARRLGPVPLPRGAFRFCSFEIPAGVPEGGRTVNIVIENTGSKPFLIRSVAVKPKTRLRALRDQLLVTATKFLGRRRAVGSVKP